MRRDLEDEPDAPLAGWAGQMLPPAAPRPARPAPQPFTFPEWDGSSFVEPAAREDTEP